MSMQPAGHVGLAAGGWTRLSLVEQLANVGSEVDRAISAHASGRTERRDRAITRALELFDLVAADERWRGARRRETRRAREEFCRLFYGDHTRPDDAVSLQKYFLHFAVAARHRRVASLKGSVLEAGDLVSPTGETWKADHGK